MQEVVMKTRRRSAVAAFAPQHPDAALKLENKALRCLTVAGLILPGASEDILERQATDLMYLPGRQILEMQRRLRNNRNRLNALEEPPSTENETIFLPLSTFLNGEEKKPRLTTRYEILKGKMNVLEKDDHLLKTKLAFKDEELTDEQAESVFLNTEVQSTEDVTTLVDYLKQYRPKLAEKIEAKL
jgi:hypothetical protein